MERLTGTILSDDRKTQINERGRCNVKRHDFGTNYGIGAYIGDFDRLSLEVSLKDSQRFADVAPLIPDKQSN